jgi:hypothetical protein
MQVSTVGLRLRYNRLTCGNMLEVSRDAVAAGKEQLVSCAPEQSKYCSICTVILGPWQCRRGGTEVGLSSCYAVCGCGAEYRSGALPRGDVRRHA